MDMGALFGGGGDGEWSITNWQCGMGVLPECKGKRVDWDTPESWKNLVDELVPVAEIGITFGIQYIAGTLEPGTMKAINSLRCMINNAAANAWNFGAGVW
jgi:hypothetical protein